jgi:capsular polysaccharide biosynthesis protein
MDRINNINNDAINLKEILAILRKRYLIIVAITLTALVMSGIYSYYVMVPVYQADAVLLVTRTASENSSNARREGMEGLVSSIAKLPEMTINTYVAQLKSEAMMARVIQKLNLDKAGYTARGLARSVGVEVDKDTNLIKVKITHTDPILATKIVNIVTQEFMNFVSETDEQQMTKSMDFLKKQAATTGEELKKVVANQNNLEANPRGVTMLEKLIAAKTEDLTKYQSLAIQAGMDYQLVQAGKLKAEQQLENTPPITEISKSDLQLEKTIITEEVNPAYTQLKALINEKTVKAAEKAVEVQSLQVINKQLANELKVLQSELWQKKKLLQLAQNEAKRLEETNFLLRSKIDETNISQSIKFGYTNLVVISPATVPGDPVTTNKMQNMAMAVALGLIVSVGLALLLNYLDNTVKTSKDLEDLLGLPVLGQIPAYNPNKPKAIGRY